MDGANSDSWQRSVVMATARAYTLTVPFDEALYIDNPYSGIEANEPLLATTTCPVDMDYSLETINTVNTIETTETFVTMEATATIEPTADSTSGR